MRRSTLLLGLVLVAAAPLGAAVADRPPVALFQSPLLTPGETAGSGLAPEVEIQAAIDARGRVTEVEVLGIAPASGYDEVFRRAVIETVGEWRYAPAIIGGEAAPATLRWKLKLVPLERAAAIGGDAGHHTVPAFAVSETAEVRRARMAALPLDLRRQLLASQVEAAEKELDRQHRRRAESPHYVVVSDGEDEATAEVVANNLESIHHLLGEVFAARVEPQPEDLKIIAYVYSRRDAYAAFARQFLDHDEFPAGFYVTTGLLAFHTEVATQDTLMSILLHEACHAYVERYLTRTDRRSPTWLAEGFANYVGNSAIKKKRLQLGATLKSRFVLAPQYSGVFRLETEAGFDVDQVKRSIKKGERLTLEQLFDADRSVFYGEKASLYYPTAWAFVHFLRHGRAGWDVDEFPTFMLYVAEGYPAPEALTAVYRRSPAELESEFLTYVARL